MPQVKKARSIDGIVDVPLPFRFKQHGKPHLQINTGLGTTYEAGTPRAADNPTVRLEGDNESQSDAVTQCRIAD